MYLRYFAECADSDVGRTALSYAQALVRIAPVRLISVGGGHLPAAWEQFRPLLATALDETPKHGHRFVNIVCASPSFWVRSGVLKIVKPGGGIGEHIPRKHELYTEGVRNVLILPWKGMVDLTDEQDEAMRRYQIVISSGGDPPGMSVPPWESKLLRSAVLNVAA